MRSFLRALIAAVFLFTVTATAAPFIQENAARYDVLATGAVTSLASDPWFGPDGAGGISTSTSSETAVGYFDVRAYTTVLVVWEGTFATAESLELDFRPIWTSGGGASNGFIYRTSAASGGPVIIQTGCGNTALFGGNEYLTAVGTCTPVRPPYFRIKTHISGATGTITGGRFTIYGIR